MSLMDRSNNTGLWGRVGSLTTSATIKIKLVTFDGSVKKSKTPFDDLTYLFIILFIFLYCVVELYS
jgi:hypothetical protein